jgi:photosystem II stability/assembly factor-like uncharacterized protein
MAATDGRKALHLATHSGWYRFEKEGGRWTNTARALTYWSATCIAVDPQDPKTIYVGTERSGIFISRDAGASWERPDPNVPRLMITSLLATPEGLLVGTSPAALYRREGGGWKEMESLARATTRATFPPNPALGSRTRYLAADPRSGRRLYAGIEVGGMLVSDDGGYEWRPANEGLSDPDVHEVEPSAKDPELVIAACGEGIFRSRNRARSWEEITPPGGLTYGTAVAEDLEGTIYLGIARGRPNTWIRAERAGAAVLASRDGGSRWEPVVEGLAGGVLDISADPEGEGVFAVTSEGELLSVGRSGSRVIAGGLPCINAIVAGA